MQRGRTCLSTSQVPEKAYHIEEAIVAGISVNVPLLFSCEHYGATADTYLCGIERGIGAELNRNVPSGCIHFYQPLGTSL